MKLLKTHTDEGHVEDQTAMGQSFSGTAKGGHNNMGLKGKRTRRGKRGHGQGLGQGQGESSMPTTARSGLDSSIHSDNGDSDTENDRGGSFTVESTRRSFNGGGNAAVAGGGGGRGGESEKGSNVDGKGHAVGGVDVSPARARGITIESIKNRFKQALPHGYRDVTIN